LVKAKLAGGKDDGAIYTFGAEVLKAIDTFASTLVKENSAILQEGITTGNVNGGEGLIFAIGYFDLLHGGGYRWDYGPNKQPWLSGGVQQAIGQTFNGSNIVQWLEGAVGIGINVQIPDGYPGAGLTIYLPPGSSDNYMEAVINGFVPRILPKLLSDQAYAAIMDRAGQLLNITEFANLGTGLRTYTKVAGDVKKLLPPTSTAALDADAALG